MRTLPLLMPLVALVGCGLVDAPGDPALVWHRGAAGSWPQNSLTAVTNSVAAGAAVVEFDVVVTADGVPVLSHDPWVHTELCTLADGTALGEDRVYIHELDLTTLQADYLCGGVPDPEHPDAEVVAEPMATLAEVLEVFAQDPAVEVHLDFKFEPGITPAADAMAGPMFQVWQDAGLDNPWYVSANTAEALLAWRELDPGVVTILAWPRFPPDTSNTQTALAWELRSTLGVQEMVDQARAAQADGLAVAWQVADRRLFEVARGEGMRMMLWTLNTEPLLAQYSRWPVDALITDYPERAP